MRAITTAPRAAGRGRLGIEDAEPARRRDAVERVRDRDAVGEREEAGEVRRGNDAATLDVDALGRERAPEPERRLDVSRGARDLLEEPRVILRPPEHGDERRRDRQAAGDLAEVEGHVRAHQVGAVRRDQALLERRSSRPTPTSARATAPRARGSRPEAKPQRPRPRLTSAAKRSKYASIASAVVAIRVRERVLLIGGERELAARSAAEREPRPGHGGGARARSMREVDQPRGERLALQREHATDVRWRERRASAAPGRGAAAAPPRPRAASSSRARRMPWRSANGLCASLTHAGRRRRALRPARAPRSTTARCSTSESSMSIDRLDGELGRHHDDRGDRDMRTGIIRRHVAGDDAAPQRRVRDDLELLRPQHEDRRAADCQSSICAARRIVSSALAEQRAARLTRSATLHRRHLRQRVHDVPGAVSVASRAWRRRSLRRRTGRAPRSASSLRNQVADHGRLVTAHRERRCHPRQQRRMAEALTGLEDLDDLLLVDQLDRALDDDVQVVRRLTVLDEDVVADGERDASSTRLRSRRDRPPGARRTAEIGPETRRQRTRRARRQLQCGSTRSMPP